MDRADVPAAAASVKMGRVMPIEFETIMITPAALAA